MQKEIADIKTLYHWINTIRTVGARGVFVLIVILWMGEFIDFDPRPILFFVIPLLILTGLLWQRTLKHGILVRPLLYGQLFADILLMTVGLYFAAGGHTPFVFLYMLIIVSASLVSLPAVIATTVGVLFSYFLLIFLQLKGFIHVPGGALVFDNVDVVGTAVFFFVTIFLAFQTYFFAFHVKKKEKDFNAIKDDFLFRTVHDLRAPSTIIRLILETYETPKWITRHPDIQKDFLIIKEVNTRMLALIRDLLSVAETGAFGLEFKKASVSLSDLLDGLIKRNAASAVKKAITVNYTPPGGLPNVVADEAWLKEVFLNLFDNAIKYNKDGGSMVIEHRVNGGMLETEIRDTGIGMAVTDLPKLFQQFYRADPHPQIQGTGLGLYIAKNLVEKMNGTIEVSSILGKGTSFVVSLPIAS